MSRPLNFRSPGSRILARIIGGLLFASFVPSSIAQEDPLKHLAFLTDFGASCVSRGAKELLIVNRHPSRTIQVKLFRYYADIRQPGRSVHMLKPDQEATSLGCDRIDNQPQRWEITGAVFASD